MWLGHYFLPLLSWPVLCVVGGLAVIATLFLFPMTGRTLPPSTTEGLSTSLCFGREVVDVFVGVGLSQRLSRFIGDCHVVPPRNDIIECSERWNSHV